jgi:predicted transcriptional regulator
MTLKEIAEILEADIIVNFAPEDLRIESACSSDMLSSILYYHTPNSLLITGLTQPQVIKTAEIAGIRIIAFVLNKKPSPSTVELAREKNIPIISTPLCMYTASGRLFKAGLPGCLNK